LIDGTGGPLIGVTEQNPNLFDSKKVPADFAPWRDRVNELHPSLYRLIVDWAFLQPDPAKPAILDAPTTGCMREIKPCAPFAGIKATLQAIAARQKQGDGWAVEVVIYGVPAWAATAGGGCERPNIAPRSRALNAAGFKAYPQLIRQLHELGDQTGAQLRFWSPWNEPNQVFFISPQRAKCDTGSPLLSPAVYARMYRAAKRELDDLPGDQQLVLGELAGSPEKGDRAGTPAEFLDALPKDVVCDSDVLGQHMYAGSETDAVAEATAAVDRRGCGKQLPVWVTETGVGDKRTGTNRDTGASALKRQCARYDDQLRQWSRNPRIKAAVQYTVREDPAYRVGLVDSALTKAYPTFDLLNAWSNRRPGQTPALPRACR
jgi:hypothetical protein